MTYSSEQNDPHDPSIPREWFEEFEAAARRPLKQRFKYAVIRTSKPVLDDATFRSFDTTADYRRWCEIFPVGEDMGVFEYRHAEEIRDCFKGHGVQ